MHISICMHTYIHTQMFHGDWLASRDWDLIATPDVPAKGLPVHALAERDDAKALEMLAQLLAHGADPNLPRLSVSRDTALHVAASEDVVSILMYIYTCVCVCMYISGCASLYINIYIFMCIYIYIYICIYVYVYICVYIHIHVCMYV